MRKGPDRHETVAKDQIHEPINTSRHTQVTCPTTAMSQNDNLGAVKSGRIRQNQLLLSGEQSRFWRQKESELVSH